MSREYLRVRPSAEPLAPRDVPTVLTSLHKLTRDGGVLSRLTPGSAGTPTFEFLALSAGDEEPVAFYYGVDESRHLETLATRLESIYPPSFDIERVDLDPMAQLLPTVAYDQKTYLNDARAGQLYHEPATHPPNAEGDATAKQLWLGTDDDGPTVSVPRSTSDAEERPHEGPVLADDGTIQAKPAVEATTPRGVEWQAFAARRKDWMTKLQPFTDVFDEQTADDDAARGRAPLAPVIEHLTEAPEPAALQVVFTRKRDWSRARRRRTGALQAGQDRLIDIPLGVEGGGTSRSAASPSDPERATRETTRLDQVRDMDPGRTFVANVRALTLPFEPAMTDREQGQLETRLDAMCAAFDPVDGPYYEVDGRRLRRGLLGGRRARTVAEQFRTGTVETATSWLPAVTNRSTRRPEFVLSGAELANFVVVPSGRALSETADRGTRAEQESRHPLPLPAPELLDAFAPPGLALGAPLDETGTPLNDTVWLPADLARLHVGRLAKTGAGKTIAGITDALSAYATTEGPVIIIDAKGGGMPTNYMRAHAARFGWDDLAANVRHFPIPDILPSLAPLNIEPRLAAGTARDQAITELVNHYEAYLRMVMDAETYDQAAVSRLLIRALVRVMYDEEYGLEHGAYRQSVNYCSQAQLEQVLDQFVEAGPPNPDPAALPQSSDPRLQARFERRLRADATTFANIVGGVGTRLDYITDDPYLRAVFDATDPRLDFRDVFETNEVLIFDLGALSNEPATIMTGVLLTSLLDAIKDHEAVTADGYAANVLIDEAAAVASADVLNDLLERGREFGVAVELLAQFPKQLELAGDREVFLNLLTNIETKLIGPLTIDEELAQALAHEDMNPTEFRNRVRRLPRGEWIAQLPSPAFQSTGPLPFSMESLPVPAGHPEGDAPFTEAEEARFQETLEQVHEATRDAYGVDDSEASSQLPRDLPETVAPLVGDEGYETAMAAVVRQAQLQTGQREANGWVPVERVDELLRTCVAASATDLEPPSYETLTDVREASRYIEVGLSDDAETVVCRLTEAGEEAAAPATGEVAAAGSATHDDVLDRVETVLAAQGFVVSILEQDRSSQPDAQAVHPDLAPTFTIEAETTTATKPIKLLENLRRAQADDHVPLFAVESGADHRAETYWAERVERVLAEPLNTQVSDDRRLYNRDEQLTFSGGASTEGGTTAVRPVTDGSRETIWRVEDDAYVLTDPSGTEHARLAEPLDAAPSRFPAVYSCDPAADKYVVHEQGEEHVYESAAAFERDWVPVKRPFVPEADLPVPAYASDTYAILLLQDDPADNDTSAVLYESGQRCPLALLLAGTYQPARSDDGGQDGIEDPAVASFAATRLVEAADAAVPVKEVYDAFETWATAHDFEVTSEEWFSRHLQRHLSFDRERRYLDGEAVRCFAGLELRTPGDDDA